MAGPFTPDTYQSGDGNLSEPVHVGREGQQVIFSNPTPTESYLAKYPTIESVPANFNGTVDIVTPTYRATVKGDGATKHTTGIGPIANRPSAALLGIGEWTDEKNTKTICNGTKWSGQYTPLSVDNGGAIKTVFIGDSMTSMARNTIATYVSITRAANVATVVQTSHAKHTGQKVTIANGSTSSFNANNVAITVIDANTWTYPSIGADDVAGTGYSFYDDSLQKDVGYVYWLKTMASGAIEVVNNAGVSGNRSSQMLARFDIDVMAYDFDLVILLTGYNDFAIDHITAAQEYANVTAIADKVTGAGKTIYIVSAIPWITSGTDTDRGEAAAYNRMLQNYCNNTKGAVYIDAASKIVDPIAATKFYPKANMLLADGIHPSPLGAKNAIATAIWTQLQKVARSYVSRLVTSNADVYGFNTHSSNVMDIAPFTNSGGTVNAPVTGVCCGGFKLTAAGNTTDVGSVVARADGIGYDQKIVHTSGTGVNTIEFGQTTPMYVAYYGVGAKLRFMCELGLSGVVGSNLKGIGIKVMFLGASTFIYYPVYNASTIAEYPPEDGVTTIIGQDMIVPPGTTSLVLYVTGVFDGIGSAITIKIGRMTIEKVV